MPARRRRTARSGTSNDTPHRPGGEPPRRRYPGAQLAGLRADHSCARCWTELRADCAAAGLPSPQARENTPDWVPHAWCGRDCPHDPHAGHLVQTYRPQTPPVDPHTLVAVRFATDGCPACWDALRADWRRSGIPDIRVSPGRRGVVRPEWIGHACPHTPQRPSPIAEPLGRYGPHHMRFQWFAPTAHATFLDAIAARAPELSPTDVLGYAAWVLSEDTQFARGKRLGPSDVAARRAWAFAELCAAVPDRALATQFWSAEPGDTVESCTRRALERFLGWCQCVWKFCHDRACGVATPAPNSLVAALYRLEDHYGGPGRRHTFAAYLAGLRHWLNQATQREPGAPSHGPDWAEGAILESTAGVMFAGRDGRLRWSPRELVAVLRRALRGERDGDRRGVLRAARPIEDLRETRGPATGSGHVPADPAPGPPTNVARAELKVRLRALLAHPDLDPVVRESFQLWLDGVDTCAERARQLRVPKSTLHDKERVALRQLGEWLGVPGAGHHDDSRRQR